MSSIAASAWSGGPDTVVHSDKFNADMVWEHTGLGAGTGTAGMIAFGTVSGGAGAALTGGNFWQGAVTGLVVSGLNHYIHEMDSEDGGDPKPKPKSKTQVRKETVKPSAAKIVEVEGNTLGVIEIARDSPMANFVRAGAPKVASVSKVLKVGGTALGVAGIGLETLDYANGNISGLEYGVDTTIALSAILVSGPAAPFVATGALIYFGGKAIYEYSSGSTLFTKPK